MRAAALRVGNVDNKPILEPLDVKPAPRSVDVSADALPAAIMIKAAVGQTGRESPLGMAAIPDSRPEDEDSAAPLLTPDDEFDDTADEVLLILDPDPELPSTEGRSRTEPRPSPSDPAPGRLRRAADNMADVILALRINRAGGDGDGRGRDPCQRLKPAINPRGMYEFALADPEWNARQNWLTCRARRDRGDHTLIGSDSRRLPVSDDSRFEIFAGAFLAAPSPTRQKSSTIAKPAGSYTFSSDRLHGL